MKPEDLRALAARLLDHCGNGCPPIAESAAALREYANHLERGPCLRIKMVEGKIPPLDLDWEEP